MRPTLLQGNNRHWNVWDDKDEEEDYTPPPPKGEVVVIVPKGTKVTVKEE